MRPKDSTTIIKDYNNKECWGAHQWGKRKVGCSELWLNYWLTLCVRGWYSRKGGKGRGAGERWKEGSRIENCAASVFVAPPGTGRGGFIKQINGGRQVERGGKSGTDKRKWGERKNSSSCIGNEKLGSPEKKRGNEDRSWKKAKGGWEKEPTSESIRKGEVVLLS